VAFDADAMAAEINDRFWQRLVLFASRRLRNRAAAEDVAQETIRRVLEALRGQRVENLAALPSFVFQTAKNVCLHHDRSARRERGALLRFGAGRTDATSDEEHPLSGILRSERAEAIAAAVQQLDESDRTLLTLLYVDALDNSEVARRLGVEPGALRVRKHRLLRKIADLVAQTSGNKMDASGTER
jgi:RNA polymerase sigma factor (sigma-70 family)